MQKALITGASRGIGLELAKIMAVKGHDLVLISRDGDELNKVKKELIEFSDHKIDITVFAADLSKPGAAQKIYNKFNKSNIKILVNNAGAGLAGNFFQNKPAANRSVVDLNVIALMELTYYFGNDFINYHDGKILNIGSIAAFMPGPKQPVYHATKAFVRSFSRALAHNLVHTGVTVTALHPGITKTKFFKSANAQPHHGGALPASVAELGYKAMMRGQVEVTHGFWNKIITNLLVRIAPYRLQVQVLDETSEL